MLLLLFLSSGCTRIPKDQNAEDDSILDAYWTLYSLEGQDVRRPQNTNTAFIRFQENENDLHGFAGCNKFSGKYKLDGEQLRLSELRTTRMACPSMENENKMMDVLRRVDSYKISGRVLTLYASGTAVATFMSGTDPSIEPGLN